VNEASPAFLNAVAVLPLVVLSIGLGLKRKADGVAFANSLASYQPVLSMFVLYDEVIRTRNISLVSLSH
jgi:hypothetical protein